MKKALCPTMLFFMEPDQNFNLRAISLVQLNYSPNCETKFFQVNFLFNRIPFAIPIYLIFRIEFNF